MKKIKILFLVASLLLGFVINGKSQGVSISSTSSNPDNSAMLDVSSSSKGILIPRMTLNERNAITTPATGLMVFQTNDTTGFYFYNGSAWKRMATGQNSQWISFGTYLYNNSNNIGIGTASPSNLLSVGSSSQMQVNSSGNIVKLNNVNTSFPASQGDANSILSNDGSGNLNWTTSPAIGSNMITPDGGYAIRLINKTGSPSVKGTIVVASLNTNNAFEKAPASSELAIGVVYEDNISDGSPCYVVVSGIASVLVKNDNTPTRGYWAGASDVAGRAYFNNGNPGTTQHDREIGHCLESKSSGTNVLVKCVIHFR